MLFFIRIRNRSLDQYVISHVHTLIFCRFYFLKDNCIKPNFKENVSGGSNGTGNSSTNSRPANIDATPFGLRNLGGLVGLGNLGLDSTNFMELQQRMQREVRI